MAWVRVSELKPASPYCKCKYPIILVVWVCCVSNEYVDMDNFICKVGKLL